MQRATDRLTLTDEELAFFRLTCDLFPNPESPLRVLEEADALPADAEPVFASLQERGLVNDSGSGAAAHLLDRLTAVSECNARVSLTVAGDPARNRDFYVGTGGAVEYRSRDGRHELGPLRSEGALAAELAQCFACSSKPEPLFVRMSAGDYLVFAVFARDVRAAPEPPGKGESPMSLEEVLAYFDEPETKLVRTPNDDTWQASIDSLMEQDVLVRAAGGHALRRRWHALAREITADRQHTITRFDFLDEQWLVREVSLYPTSDSVFRLGTERDGAVVVEELSAVGLADVVAGVIGTLPNLLNPEAPLTLRHPMLVARGMG